MGDINENTLPEGWRCCALDEISDINPKESIKKGELATNIPMDCLKPFTRKINKCYKKKYSGGSKFRNGDVLVARITPCLENGKTAYVDILNQEEIGFGSTEYIVIREKEKISDKKFLFYFTISPRFREIAIKSMTGTSGRQRVQIDVLTQKKFSLPQINEQKKIANLLSSFDNKIELLEEQNKTLEEIAQTIFKEWFGKYQLGDELPEGWRIGKLEEEFDIIMGQSPRGSSYNNESKGVIFFQGRTDFQTRFPKVRMYTSEPKRFACKYDVLLSVRAPVGDVNIAIEECCIGRGLSAIKSKYGYNSYCLYKLKSLKPIFDLYESEGTVYGSITKDSLSNLEIIIPTGQKVLDFDKKISKIDEKYYKNYLQICSLKDLRDKLLPELMNGSIRL